MNNIVRSRSFSIKMTVVGIFLSLSSVTLVVTLSLQYYFGQNLAKDAAATTFNITANAVSEKIYSLDDQSSELALMLSEFPEIGKPIDKYLLHPATSAMAQAMKQKQFLYAIYIGYGNGDFYELINLDNSDNLRSNVSANANDRWQVIKIYNTLSGRKRCAEFYDRDFKLTHRSEELSDYYSNIRPWYKKALQSDKTIKTDPYLFHQSQQPGVTYAKRVKQTDAVVAVDITLTTTSDFLEKNRPLNSGQSIIFDANGKIISHSFDTDSEDKSILVSNNLSLSEEEREYIRNLGVLKVSNEFNWPPFDFSYSGKPHGYSIDIMNLLAQKIGLSVQYTNGYSWKELTSLFLNYKLDIVHSIFPVESQKSWGLFTKPFLNIPTTLITLNQTSIIHNLKELEGRVVAIPKGWSILELIKTNYPSIKIFEAKDSLSAFNAVISGQAYAAFETKQVAQYLIDIYCLDSLKIQPKLEELNEFASLFLTIMVHNDQEQLRNLLNRAIGSITEQERQAIENRWLKIHSVMIY